MRTIFIQCKTRKEARHIASWAAVIAKAEGGFWAFESAADYQRWRRQK